MPDEKKAAEGYTASGSGVTEVERPWCSQPVYQPDPRAVFRPTPCGHPCGEHAEQSL